MPKREDIKSVLVIGSGPIVIGQACEFDYSGTQACRVLKEEGLRVILINSNPATIMTDPEFADATYVEPITPEYVEMVIEREAAQGHPIDALLATLGGQTALNTAISLSEAGVLDKHGVELIGANIEAIHRGAVEADTGLERTTVTNGSGHYNAVLLPLGVYHVSARLPGFAVVHAEPVVLRLGQALVVDLVLPVAAVTAAVEVRATAADGAAAGTRLVITGASATNLPSAPRSASASTMKVFSASIRW